MTNIKQIKENHEKCKLTRKEYPASKQHDWAVQKNENQELHTKISKK